MVKKVKKITMFWSTSCMEIYVLKPLIVKKLSLFSEMSNDTLMLKVLITHNIHLFI